MGWLSKINKKRKDTFSSINKERKRIGSDLAEIRNDAFDFVEDNPWAIAALIAAPYALPAMMGTGAAAGGTGFMSTLTQGGMNLAGMAKASGGALLSGAQGLLPGAGPGAATTTGGGGGFFSGAMNIAKSLGGDIAAKIKDPKYMAEMLQRAGSHLMGAKLAGDGLSDDERKLMEALAGDLGSLRTNDQKAFDAQMRSAHELMGRADQYDPEYYGLKAQRDVQTAGAVQMRQADRDAKMREGGRGLSAADRRRAGLEITRDAQSAYLEGREHAGDMKTKTFAAGAALIPGQSPNQAVTAGLNLAGRMDTQDNRRREVAADTGTFIQDAFGFDKPRSKGGLDLGDAANQAEKIIETASQG